MGSENVTNSTFTAGYLEQKLYQEFNHLWGQDTSNQIKHKWKRYLDDCFIIWDLGQDKLDQTRLWVLTHLVPKICLASSNWAVRNTVLTDFFKHL